MTSSVISSCAGVIASFSSSAMNGLSVPKASECSSTPTGRPPARRRISATVSRRLSWSAALTLKKCAWRPRAAIAGENLLDVRHRLAAIEMDAEDIVAGGGELERRSLAEAARGTENQSPTGFTC